jgi:hypothetical protein
MKTRDELVYDFMLALAANPSMTPAELQPSAIAEMIKVQAESLANELLGLGGL